MSLSTRTKQCTLYNPFSNCPMKVTLDSVQMDTVHCTCTLYIVHPRALPLKDCLYQRHSSLYFVGRSFETGNLGNKTLKLLQQCPVLNKNHVKAEPLHCGEWNHVTELCCCMFSQKCSSEEQNPSLKEPPAILPLIQSHW